MQIKPQITQILPIGRKLLLFVAATVALVACGDGPTQTQKKSVSGTRSSEGAGVDLADPRDAVAGEIIPEGKPAAPIAHHRGQFAHHEAAGLGRR